MSQKKKPAPKPDSSPEVEALDPQKELAAYKDYARFLFDSLQSAVAKLPPGTPAPNSAEIFRGQARIIEREQLKSNSLIEIITEGSMIKVHSQIIDLSPRQWIIFEILANRLLKRDYGFISIADMADTIDNDYPDSMWKDPTTNEVSKVIHGIKNKICKKLNEAAFDSIFESPSKTGNGYGYRLSIPPQNIIPGHDEKKDEFAKRK